MFTKSFDTHYWTHVSSFCLCVGEGCSTRNPSGSLNQGDHGVSGVKNAQRASSPVPGHQKETALDEHAAPTEPQIG